MRFEPRGTADYTPFPGLSKGMSALLRLRGIDTEEAARKYLNPSLSDLHDPFRMPGMRKAADMIRGAAAAGDPVLVWGDYDVDGVCAAVILAETLREEGAAADYYLPSRHEEGYGLNEEGIRAAAAKYKLLVTVDCGISNREETALAKELGMSVIVTDHHSLPQELPEADAVIHPLLGDYPCPFLCGAGVALKICQALQGMAGAEKRLDLAALATVADVVPLKDENRAIVREGMRRMEDSARPGLKALMQAAAVSSPLRTDDLGFRLGPRLNAAGRLEHASVAAELLETRDPERGAELARQLNELNSRRQSMERQMTAEAMAMAMAQPGFAESRSIVVHKPGWNEGLAGLTAGRLCERFHKPAVVLTGFEDTANGSCRSIPGVNIFDMLSRCGDTLLRFGGHAQAAGVMLFACEVDCFREKLEQAIRENCDPAVFEPVQEYDLCVPFRGWNPDNLKDLELLEPTGCGNPAPVFLLRGASVQSMRRVGKDQAHLQMSLLDGQTFLKGIGFFMADRADPLWRNVDVLYRPVLNTFNGNTSVEAQVSAVREG